MSTEHAHPHHGHGHHHHAEATAETPAPTTEAAAVTETPVGAEAQTDTNTAVVETAGESDSTVQTDVVGTSDIANDPNNPAPGGLLIEADKDSASAETEQAPPPAWPEGIDSLDDKIEHLYARLVNLEGMVGAIANNGNKMAMQFGQTQGALNQIGQMMAQMAQRLNAMDPKRPILEVTLCKYQPVVDLDKKEFAFKATFHGETHPERPNDIDALRLDLSDPTAPHWVPVGVSPGLKEYIRQKFTEADIALETWSWIKLAEKTRPTGETADFADGEDTSEPAPEGGSLSVENADAVSTFANGEQPDPGVSEALAVNDASIADTNEA